MPMNVGLRGDGAQPLASLQSKCPRQRQCARGKGAGPRGHPGAQGRRWGGLDVVGCPHLPEGIP